MFAYSNNGLSMRAVDPSYLAVAGEVLFPDYASVAELTAAFAGYATAIAPTIAQQAAAAIMAGLTITLSGSVSLTALFPTDPATTGKLGAVVTTLVGTGAFPGGGTSYPMKDSGGAWHTFTAAQYKAVAGGIAAYVAALDLIIDGNPSGATALPPSTISITA